ncbi:hypothetical protein BV898_14438 [Hypsibius exemplaris]|uniref:Ig-like domain-containing protein n=1 Tax=Hypsibius exemplaris TaxID=2072580 RepID=A0A9X6NAJ4_HYPEX|nr:hypothetical protein BV898_14438 [Hypsibius exemplaris]
MSPIFMLIALAGFAGAIIQTDPGAPPTEVDVTTYVRCPFDRRCTLRCAQPGQSTEHIKNWKSNRFIAGFLPPHPVQSPYLERNGRYIVLQRVVNNRTKLGAQYDTRLHLGYSHIPDYLGDLNDLMYSIERRTFEGEPVWTEIGTYRADKYFYDDGRLRPTMVDAHEVSAVWRRGNGLGNNVTDLDFGPVPLALTSPNGHDGDFPKLVSPENGPPQFVLWTDGSLTILNTVRGQQPYFACYNRWDSTNGKLLTDPKDFQFIASYVVDRVPAVTVTNGRGRDFRRGTTDTTLSPQSPKGQTITCTISTFGTSLQDYHVSWWKDGKLFLDVPMTKSGRLPETLKTYCSTSKRKVMANVIQIFDSPFVDRPDLIRAHLSFFSTPAPGEPPRKPIPNEVGDPGTVMWVDTPGQNVTNFRAAVNRTANTVSFEWDGTSEAIVPYLPYAKDDIDPYQVASMHIQADPAHPLFGWHKYSVVPWCGVRNGSLGSPCGPRSMAIEFHVPSDPCSHDPPFFTIPSDPFVDPRKHEAGADC